MSGTRKSRPVLDGPHPGGVLTKLWVLRTIGSPSSVDDTSLSSAHLVAPVQLHDIFVSSIGRILQFAGPAGSWNHGHGIMVMESWSWDRGHGIMTTGSLWHARRSICRACR